MRADLLKAHSVLKALGLEFTLCSQTGHNSLFTTGMDTWSFDWFRLEIGQRIVTSPDNKDVFILFLRGLLI